jgi:hypothetical protein
MEWKTVGEIGVAVVGLAAIFRNTVIVARFITFVSELRPTIDRIALNTDRAVHIAERAEKAATKAQEAADENTRLTQHQDTVLSEQSRALEQIDQKLSNGTK